MPKHRSENVGDRRQEGALVGSERSDRGENESSERAMCCIEANNDEVCFARCGIRQMRTEHRGAGSHIASTSFAAQISIAAQPERDMGGSDRVRDPLEHGGKHLRRRITCGECSRYLGDSVQQRTVVAAVL